MTRARGPLERCKPRASARLQLALAAGLWTTVGSVLLASGGRWALRSAAPPLGPALLALGIALGLLKGRFILDRTARTHRRPDRRAGGRAVRGGTSTRNAFLPFKKKVNYDTVAWCTFTDPELAHAEMTEDEARKLHGDRVQIYRWSYGDTDRGRTDNTELGLAKFIVGPGGRLLGAHILAERAGDIIHEAQLLRHLKLPFSTIAQMIHIYPTYTDVVRQPAKRYYIDRLRSNPVIKVLAMLLGKKK